jgi:ELWxxDGT repeat protein
MAASNSWRTAAASLSLLAASALATADEPYLVRDIHPGFGPALGSQPVLIQTEDGPAFLFAQDEEHGRELWLTDGTADGTRLLRDVCPGRCSSDPVFQGFLGGRLIFSARSMPFGPWGLWISDGTWEGSLALGGGRVSGAAAVGVLEDRGLFFFAAKRDGVRGLWATDGTPGGTRPVGHDGPAGWPRSPFGDSTATGRLIFGASALGGSHVPWVTDGTDEGTHPLETVAAGPRHRDSAEFFHRLGSRTTFFVRSSSGADPCETELWASDGTPERTQRLAVLEEPRCFGPRFTLESVLRSGGAIWFSSPEGDRRQLWRSDGTRAGTRAVTSFTGGASVERLLAAGDGEALFSADDGVHGLEPWLADAGGARLLADLCPGLCSSSPEGAWFPGGFYFAADDGSNGRELWRVEGDAVVLVEDVCPGSCGSSPAPVAAAAGRAYFAAGELGGQPGRELWSTAVGGNGAARLTDFSSADPFPSGSDFASSAVAAGDRIFFTADDGEHGLEVWKSDGSLAGTALVVDVETRTEPGAGSDPAFLTPWGDRLLFFAYDPDFGYQPWVSDGTEAGTRRLGTALDPFTPTDPLPYGSPLILGGDALFLSQPGFDGAVELWRSSVDGPPVRLSELNVAGRVSASSAQRIGERAVFSFLSTERGASLMWSSDGTAAGTESLAGISSSGGTAGELGGRLYFDATTDPDSEDWELWQTDGTSAGTERAVEIVPGPGGSHPGPFARLGDRLLFGAETPAQGRELWITDGTPEGTRLVADLVPGRSSSFPGYLTTIGERVLFFTAGVGGYEWLWATDGTAEGTTRLALVPRVSGTFESPQIAAAGGRLFYASAVLEDSELELWVSDGTPSGTGSLQSLFPPAAFVHVTGVWGAGDRVRLSLQVVDSLQENLEERLELWESDGTFAGTRRLLQMPCSGCQPISELTESGGWLFFQATHPEAGRELMALPLGPPVPCAPGAETLCLRGGRFAVRVRWRDPRSGDQGAAGALPLPGSDRTGLFWFFSPDNVELVFKTLDGGPVNGFYWNFYGALSDVEYTIEVTDTATGRRTEYFNPGGEICGRGDTTAFLARPPVPLPVPPPFFAPVRSAAAAGAGGTACSGDPGDLCLLGGRFRVEVEWADQRSGDSGLGTAIPFADLSGFFWFFEPQNVELVVKILDGTAVNGRFWVFYGGLSDVAYTITVTDTETGEQAVYDNPPGEICGRGDTTAF